MSTQPITLDSARFGSFQGAEPVEPTRLVPAPTAEDAIRARLADVARQEEKRRSLSAFFERDTPAWNPDDHPEIDVAGGAAAWVKKMRRESDRASMRRSRRARS
jgi:uncharacterized protein YfaQ (DUF2300 family)